MLDIRPSASSADASARTDTGATSPRSRTRVVIGSAPSAIAPTTRSRSVTTATSVSASSQTGSSPRRRSRRVRATSTRVSPVRAHSAQSPLSRVSSPSMSSRPFPRRGSGTPRPVLISPSNSVGVAPTIARLRHPRRRYPGEPVSRHRRGENVLHSACRASGGERVPACSFHLRAARSAPPYALPCPRRTAPPCSSRMTSRCWRTTPSSRCGCFTTCVRADSTAFRQSGSRISTCSGCARLSTPGSSGCCARRPRTQSVPLPPPGRTSVTS